MAYKTFTRACVMYASHGKLNLDNVQLISLYQECLVMTDFLKDDNTQMLVNRVMGQSYKKDGKTQEAIHCYEKQLETALRIGNGSDKIKAYGDLGTTFEKMEKYSKALENYEKGLEILQESSNKFLIAQFLCNIGALNYSIGDYHESIRHSKSSLDIYSEMGLKNYQKTPIFNIANANLSLQKYGEAVSHFQECLQLARQTGDLEMEARACDMLGDIHLKENRFPDAIKYQERCLELSKETRKRINEGEANQKLGASYMSIGRFQEALVHSKEALKIALETGDKESEANAYFNLGKYYEANNDFEKAHDYFKERLAISQRISSKKTEASANGNLGNLHRLWGKFHDAIKFHERQLCIAKEIGDTTEETKACGSLGVNYKVIGDFSNAIKYFKEGLDLIAKYGGDKNEEAASYANLGDIYTMLGKTAEAIDCHQRSLSLSKEVDNKAMEIETFPKLGAAYSSLGKSLESKQCFEEALDGFENIGPAAMNQAKIYGYQGEIHHSLGDFKKAMEFQKKSLQIAEETDDVISKANAAMETGTIFLLLKDYRQAIESFQQARQIAIDVRDKSRQAQCCSQLGSAFTLLANESRKNNDEKQFEEYIVKSIDILKECLHCYDWIFDHIHEYDDFKVSMFDTFIHNYKVLTSLLIEKGEGVEALLVSERGKARALEDLLVSKYRISQDLASKQEPISYAEIEQMASRFCIMFFDLAQGSLLTWIIDSENALVFDAVFPDNIVNDTYDTLKVREVQCENRLINASEEQDEQNPTGIQKPSVVDVSSNLLFTTSENNKERCIPDEDLYDVMPCPLKSLYKAVISPALQKITQEEIVIIPDGPLFEVPFAALKDPETGLFLSEIKRIRLAPSLTSLQVLQQSPTDFHSKTGALIIGNPQVGQVMFRGKEREISNLPCAEQEARMISDVLGVKPFIGPQATKEAIKQNLREDLAVIHFAAHGTTDGEILLTPSTTDSLPNEENYILTMQEVQESGVRPQLVVLSCCHSGRGEVKAEGVVGMSRAFLAAGARAVIASLWAIADEATMVFMEKLYTHLTEGKSASRSLQQAMDDMRKIPRYSDPMFWAPFFLIGEDVTITIEGNRVTTSECCKP